MKKFSIILLSLIMVFSLTITGCSGTEDTIEQPEEVKPAELEGEITIMVPAGGYYLEHTRDYIAKEFMEEYPGVKVNVEQEPDGGQFTARISAGDIPDIKVGVFGYEPAKYAKQGLLVDLKTMPESDELFDRIAPQYVHEDFGGRYYVPWNATTQMMIYNKDLFREAGLDPNAPPETFDEYLEYAEKLNNLPKREDGSSVYGNVFWNEALAWGGWYWTMNSQVYYNFNNAEYQLFNKLGTDVVFDNPDAKMTEFYTFMDQAQEYAPESMDGNDFFSRRVGMWLQFGYGWMANLDEAKDQPMVIGEDVGVAPIPTVNKGDTSWSTLDGRSLMIFKSNPEQEKLAWEFVKFMMRDDINLQSLKDLAQLPTLKSLEGDEYFQRPEIKPFVDQLQHTVPNESVAELDDVSNVLLQNYVKTVIKDEMTPEEAVNDAAKQSRDLLFGE